MKTITRRAAKKQGLKLYYTDKPCLRGHITSRYTSNKKCIECSRIHTEVWYINNPNKVREYSKDKAKNNLYCAQRRARKLQASPIWLNEEDMWMIEETYSLCHLRSHLTKVLHHVDHIIPLKGINVCGLHVPSNLQVIPAIENIRKNNKF